MKFSTSSKFGLITAGLSLIGTLISGYAESRAIKTEVEKQLDERLNELNLVNTENTEEES